MRPFFVLFPLCVSLAACVSSHEQIPFEVTVVDAETFEPVPGAEVHTRYSSEMVANYPTGTDAVTGVNGRVRINMQDWGNTYLQAAGSRYHVYSCGVAPRGWLHPDGIEFGEGFYDQGGAALRMGPDRDLPAADPSARPVAVHLRPLAPLPHGEGGNPQSISQQCRFFELFASPARLD